LAGDPAGKQAVAANARLIMQGVNFSTAANFGRAIISRIFYFPRFRRRTWIPNWF
jgi:hypothetical protein